MYNQNQNKRISRYRDNSNFVNIGDNNLTLFLRYTRLLYIYVII
jgi:hypothetical protein